MKKLLYIVGCLLVLGSSPARAQGDQPSTIVVRTVEVVNRLTIYTARGGQKAEMQELKFSIKNSYEEVTAQYQKIIASYLEQGYVLQSMTTVDRNNPNNMFIFVKAPKP